MQYDTAPTASTRLQGGSLNNTTVGRQKIVKKASKQIQGKTHKTSPKYMTAG